MIRLLFAGFLMCILSSGLSHAQNLTLSPYSRYGVGDIFPSTTTRNMGMGDLGVATLNYASVNRMNPASYSDIFFTTLDISGFSQLSNLKSLESEENQFSAGFQNISFAFPSNKNLVIAFGFNPYSAVGYNIISQEEVLIQDTLETSGISYSAEGGLNQAFLGAATTFLKKKLKVGANAFYSFGNTRNQWSSIVATQSLNNYTDVQVERATFIYGGGLNLGVIYGDTLSGRAPKGPNDDPKPLVIYRIGATLEYNFDLQGDRMTTYTNRVVTDTIGEMEVGTVILPPKYGLGVSFTSPGRWEVSAEATFRDWGKFQYFTDDVGTGQSYRVAAGGEWTPSLEARNYFGRMSYRLGFHTSQLYLNFEDRSIQDNGVTMGIGLPASRRGTTFFNRERGFSMVNIGVDIGRRGSLKDGLPLEETYYRFRLGVTINERWFRQYKID